MKLARTILTLAAVVTTSLTLSTHAAPPVPVSSGTADVKTGQTVIKFDSGFLTALEATDVTFKKVAPGKIVAPKGELRLPIVGGSIDLATFTAEIINSGGLIFSQEEVTVSAIDFIITYPAAGSEDLATVSAVLVHDGVSLGRVALFDFEATVAAPFELPKNKKVAIKDIELTLTQEGADALNLAFGVVDFADTTVIGVASFSATTVKGSL